MSKNKPNEYKTENGVAKWTTKLSPRESSGLIGETVAETFYRIGQIAEIQALENVFTQVMSKRTLQLYTDALHNVVMANKEFILPKLVEEITDLSKVETDTTVITEKIETKEQLKLYLAEKCLENPSVTKQQIMTNLKADGWNNEQINFALPSNMKETAVSKLQKLFK